MYVTTCHAGLQGGTAVRGSRYGESSGPIWLNAVDCIGNEARLDQCPLPLGWSLGGSSGNEACSHSEEAGVVCYTGKTQFLYTLFLLSCRILKWSILLRRMTSTTVMHQLVGTIYSSLAFPQNNFFL